MAFPIENFLSFNMTNILITFVIPFLIFFTVLLVTLKRTKVFGSNNFVYILLAGGLTVMIYALKPATFQFLASYLFQIGVAGAIISLGGLTLIIFFTIIKRGYTIAEKIGKSDAQKVEDLKKQEEKLMKKFYEGGLFGPNTAKRMQIQKELDQIKEQEKYYLAKLRRLK